MKLNTPQLAFYLVLMLLVPVKPADAQSSDTGYWLNYNLRLNFTEKIGTHIDLNLRNYEFFHDLEQGLIRGFLYYNIPAQKLQLAAGAAWSHAERFKNEGPSKSVSEERRLHQQVLFNTIYGRVSINHRYRIEERFFSDNSNLRFRYQVNLQLPLNKKSLETGAVYLLIMDEIFLNDISPVFDRNRLLCSTGYVISPLLRVEAGMLWQMYENSHKKQFLFTINQHLNFYKKD